MANDRPDVPLEELRSAAGDHPETNAALGAFHSEFSSPNPDREKLEHHAAHLLTLPSIFGPFERWWLNPRVQAFLAELNATGI